MIHALRLILANCTKPFGLRLLSNVPTDYLNISFDAFVQSHVHLSLLFMLEHVNEPVVTYDKDLEM